MPLDHASHAGRPDAWRELERRRPWLWTNPARLHPGSPDGADSADPHALMTLADGVDTANRRLTEFAPLLSTLFPELAPSAGVVDSPLLRVDPLAAALGLDPASGRLFVKADHALPVVGSIKARGGIHAVLEIAERVARAAGLWSPGGAAALGSAATRTVFARHRLSVGSTGNLGLSVGTIGRALGFDTVVHMSSGAKPWKKDRLRRLGVRVVEHAGSYEQALASGRADAGLDPAAFFIDDENSLPLLLGYATAIDQLRRQLDAAGVVVDRQHPLFVYVPCGVGGAPAGLALGLWRAFGAAAHCFFAEPVESPCVLVNMTAAAGPAVAPPSVHELGLSGRTEADGLAVARASALATGIARPLVSGIYTVDDARLFEHLRLAHGVASMRLEPSAAAGFSGPAMLVSTCAGQTYLDAHGLCPTMPSTTHIVWTTGGSLVPDDEFSRLLERGRRADHAP